MIKIFKLNNDYFAYTYKGCGSGHMEMEKNKTIKGIAKSVLSEVKKRYKKEKITILFPSKTFIKHKYSSLYENPQLFSPLTKREIKKF